MVERTPFLNFVTQVILFLGLVLALAPFAIVAIAAIARSAHVNEVPMPLVPGTTFLANIAEAWTRADLGRRSSTASCLPGRGRSARWSSRRFRVLARLFPLSRTLLIFWLIFITLMLPLEVRIVPTYAVAANVLSPIRRSSTPPGSPGWSSTSRASRIALHWGLLNSYTGLILPLIATATGTFLYRQFFLTIPDELVEAAKMDGAGALRFFLEILLPLSRTNMAALSRSCSSGRGTSIFGRCWSRPTGPTARRSSNSELVPAPTASRNGTSPWRARSRHAAALLVVILMQRWFVRGLVSTEK